MPLHVTPLHPAQRDILMDLLINAENSTYNVGGVTRLTGPLHKETFIAAAETLPVVFDVFRMRFDLGEQAPQAYLDDTFNRQEVICMDFTGASPAAVEKWIRERLEIPFVLQKENALCEQYLLSISPEEHYYFSKYHHLINDGYGLAATYQYVARKYQSLLQGTTLEWSPVSYVAAAGEALAYQQSPAYQEDAAYWREKIDKKPAQLLERRYANTNTHPRQCRTFVLEFTAAEKAALVDLQQTTQANLLRLTLAALTIYFARTTEHAAFAFGTPVHRRRDTSLQQIAGMFSGITPFQAIYQQNDTVAALLENMAITRKNDNRHQQYQVADLSRSLKLNGTTEQLVDILVNHANLNFNFDFGENIQAVTTELTSEITRYPLELLWRDYGEGQPLELKTDYYPSYFTETDIRLFVKRLLHIIQQFKTGWQQTLEEISILPEEEQTLLASFNNNKIDVDPYPYIHALIEEQVKIQPTAEAVLFEDQTLTYRQLDEKANQLAHYLREKGVREGTFVPVCMERSAEMVLGILAVLKAGGAYVPVDPAYPQHRITFMLQDTRAAIVLSNLPPEQYTTATIVDIRQLADVIGAYPVTPPETALQPQHPAYVIYTSGSTGNPKGVTITHQSLVASTQARIACYGNTGTALLVPSFSFDSSVAVIFGTLCSGGSLIVCREETLKDAETVKQLLTRTDMVLCVPSYYRFLLEEGLLQEAALTTVILAGEALEVTLAHRHFREVKKATLYNEYGPTECTVWSSVAQIQPGDKQITIGKPVANMEVHILDAQQRTLPVGVTGELYISGPQVANGYLHLPAMTAEKFITDAAGNRLYKTGDTGRWLPDGNIEYLGRIDDQVKIRGYRIELGEIGHALQECEGVKHAVVVAWTDERNNKRLVGYVTTGAGYDKMAVLNRLKEKLPEYMVPSVLVELAQLPLSVNGKVDKKALPAPEAADLQLQEYVAPRNETERQLAAIWQELLALQQVGIYDNFIELGGDSIVSMQVVSRARRLGYELKAKDLFKHQTVAALAQLLSAVKVESTAGEQGMLTGRSGLLPIQHWYFEEGPALFTQQLLLEADKKLSPVALEAALHRLVQYHDALRFVYQQDADGWQQSYGTAEPTLHIRDMRRKQKTWQQHIPACVAESQARLDIHQGILLQATLLQTPAAEAHNRLLLVVHHLAIDGVSWRILLEDLNRLLEQPTATTDVVLGAKGSSCRQWQEALTGYANNRGRRQQRYWETVVAKRTPLHTDLPYTGKITVSDIRKETVRLDAAATRRLLQEVSAAYRTEINDILLAALAMTLTAWNKGAGVLVGLEGHGREEITPGIAVNRTVGWFTSQYPVWLEAADGVSAGRLIRDIKEQLRQVPDKGIGYGVNKYIGKQASLQGAVPWEVGFNYLGQGDNLSAAQGAVKASLSSLEAGGAPQRTIPEKLTVNSMVSDGELSIEWSYSQLHFHEATIAELAAAYRYHLETLIAHCAERSRQAPVLSPSDYGLGGAMTNDELDRFLSAKKSPVAGLYRLTGLQEGMLFHGLYDEKGGSYIEQFGCELPHLDVDAFRKSWEHLVQHHTIFRSAFYAKLCSVPVQCVHHEVDLPFAVLDYRHMTATDRQEALQAWMAADRQQGLDFEKAPLMRITLFRLEDNTYRMQWTYHHLLMDGWSLPVLLGELVETYEAILTHHSLPSRKTDDFGDYIRFLADRDLVAEETYWRSYLSDVTDGCLLPFVATTASRTRGGGHFKETALRLDAAVRQQLERFTQQQRITLNTLVQGVWAYLLSRYTGKSSAMFGVTVAGRPDELPGADKKVGLYINTLPLYTMVANEQTIAGWLQDIQATQLQSREHQYAALNDIQHWAGIREELFDSLLVFENYPENPALQSPNWKLQLQQIQVQEQANYPLTIRVMMADGLEIGLVYNETMLDAADVRMIAAHFEQVLLQIATQPVNTIADIALLTAVEKTQLLYDFNQTAAPYPADKSIVALFEEQAAQTPDAVAVVYDTTSFTYQALDEAANRLAHRLQDKGLKAGAYVPLCLKRSAGLMVAVLGILKAGGAYVPVNPEYPAERILQLLNDCDSPLIITDTEWKDTLETIADKELLYIDHHPELLRYPAHAPAEQPAPAAVAYVMYTSGSTGKPKGVAVTHKNVVSLVKSQEYITLTNDDVILSAGSLSFDATTFEFWGALLNGGCLVLSTERSLLDIEWLKQELQQRRVTKMFFTTSWFNQLVDMDITVFTGLQEVLTGGEKISEKHADKFRRACPHVALTNIYGPTENTTFSLYYRIHEASVSGNVPIGRPLKNRTAYILDSAGQPVPVGVTGELYVGGDGVAKGYLDAEMTATRFMPDPFTDDPEARIYRTGDLARWMPDGNIVYMGRVDEQVKIRGFRIEPGETARVLEGCPAVKQAVVTVWTDPRNNRYLTGYVVPEDNFDKEAIMAYLKERLPDYMTPSFLIALEALPLTANGKVDKKALPAPDMTALSEAAYMAPRNEHERMLVDIWQQLLGRDRIGIHDHFFETGGHSLLAMRLQSAIRKQLQAEMPVKAIFHHPTIAGQAAYILQQTGPVQQGIIAEAYTGPQPLSFAQERLWFIDRLTGSIQYHIPVVYRLTGTVNKQALEMAIREMVNRHAVLRTIVTVIDEVPHQQVMDKDGWQLEAADRRDLHGNITALHDYVKSLIDAPFNLSADHVLRGQLIELSEQECLLALTLHHIAGDGWSVSIFMKELMEIYAALDQQQLPVLPPLDIQYTDYSRWQRTYMSTAVLEQQQAYWNHQLADVTTLQLPLDYTRPAVFSNRGAIIPFHIDGTLRQQLQALSQQEGATLFMTLLAAFKVLLHRYSGQEDITVGSPVSGRTRQETESLIGCFVNTLALRTQLHDNPTFAALLQKVKNTTLDAYEHQDVPFEKVVEAVVKERDLSYSPLFQVIFTLQNLPVVTDLVLGAACLQPERIAYTTAQVDLNFTLEETATGLSGNVEYCTDLFKEDTVLRMIAHFKQLLAAIVANPSMEVGFLPMLMAEEEIQLLDGFNQTDTTYPADKSITDLFAGQAALTPDATALVFEGREMTYEALDIASTQLAQYLVEAGVTPGMRVPVCMERSDRLIVAILAVLKVGGAYVPVDPHYPAERISFMLSESNSQLVLTTTMQLAALEQTGAAMQFICLDQVSEMLQTTMMAAVLPVARPQDMAYVIYTSGSTGTPKGVMVSHQNVVSLVKGADYVSFRDSDRLLSTGAPSFDAATFEYWGMLLNGGRLILCPEQQLLDNDLLKREIRTHQVNMMWFTASWFNQLIDTDIAIFETLSVVLAGGEKLSEEHISKLKQKYPALTVINGYGPTENTTFSLTYTVAAGAVQVPVPVGRPLSNRKVYVLDSRRQLVPVGVTGEIYVGGAGLALGYLNLPELTAERFISHRFSNNRIEKLYKTGDLGCWQADGNVLCLGRTDDQVKIRGYRIEPGETERVLQQCEWVEQAVVMARTNEQGTKYLAGYIVPAGGFEKEKIQSWLRQLLPDYMVPAVLVPLEKLPLTGNGKVNKRALPEPDPALMPAAAYVPPRNATELVLTGIWQQLLKVSRVGIYDNFFELGGHSLLVTRVVSAIRRELEVEIPIRDLFNYPVVATLADHIRRQQPGTVLPAVTVSPRDEKLPLSSAQERLWFIDWMEGSVAYHMPLVLKLDGDLDVTALKNALETIVERHEALRTVFREEDGTVSQYILPGGGWQLQVVDRTTTTDRESILEEITQWCNQPFDLKADYMMRVHLVQLAPREYFLVIVQHHIASDGWSVSILLRELVRLYEAAHRHQELRLEPLPVQYADYALWHRHHLQGAVLDQQLAYWKEKLEDTATLQLPIDFPRPATQSTRGNTLYYEVDGTLTAGIHQLCRQQGATLFMTMLAAFKVLLYRYSGQEDICVGSPIANRTQQTIEPLIGFFVNTIALRSNMAGNPDFLSLLKQVKATLLEAYQYQDAPFEKIVEAVVSDRDMSRTPLFQVMFILQNLPEVPHLQLDDVQVAMQPVANSTSKFDLTVDVTTTDSGMRFRVEYCSDLYEEATIARMMEHYLVLLEAIVAAPSRPIGALPMLTVAEEKQLLQTFNNTANMYPAGKAVIDLFEAQAQQTPDAAAVVFGPEQYTYRQLNEKANQLAHYLRQKGVVENTLIPVCMSRSLDMITAIVGILKAGATYVPVDPAYPEVRIRYILADTHFSLMITDKRSQELLPADIAAERILVLRTDGEENILSGLPVTNPDRYTSPEKITYLIYTSGSTGQPKGVEMPDRALFNLLCWQQQEIDTLTPKRILQFASINFDVSFQEIFFTLSFGGCLHLVDEQRRKDMAVLMEQINTEKINCLFLPYVVLKNLAEYAEESGMYPQYLEEVITAGEQLKLSDDLRLFLEKGNTRLHNQYGPTEAHVVSAYTIRPEDYARRVLPPIGKPIANTRLYILDASGNPCPVGVPGELFIGGVQVAKGYLNLPELTAERFMADPFDVTGKGRVYKTGDICCWLPDGNINYLARKDDQVKIRGNRVEIGEVESVLGQCELVAQCVVLVKEDQYSNKRLIAYVVPQRRFGKDDLRTWMQSRLPDYMIPSLFITLPELPLTNNGKINKRALPEADLSALGAATYVAARNLTEQQLTDIWRTLLQVEKIGIHDNFFELGGHSLLAMRLQSALRKHMEVEIAVKSIFAHPTIARLAAFIRQNGKGWLLPAVTPQQRPALIPLSYSQERLWFIDQMEGSVQYHMPVVLRMEGALDKEALSQTFQDLVDRHEVLRSVIVQADGHSGQRVLPSGKWQLQHIDLCGRPQEIADYRALVHILIRKPFDLTKDHMLRVYLIALDATTHILVMNMHHIASDGWSISVLFRELLTLYHGYTTGEKVKLPALDIQYADYAIWQREYMSDEVLAEQLAYWKENLKDVQPLQLPTDKPRPAVKGKNGAVEYLQIDKELTDRLLALSQQEGVTLFMTLLAALKVLLFRYSGQEDICVGSPISGRTRQEVEGLAGFFINTLALRNNLAGNPAFLALLQQVKQTTLSAYEYQEVPFEKIVDAVVTERDMSRSPLFQVMLVLQNTPDIPELTLGAVQLSEEPLDHISAVFDLNFCLKETTEGLSLIIQYSTDLFYHDTVTRMGKHFEQLLRSITRQPAAHICALSLLDEAEEQQLLEGFNSRTSAVMQDMSLPGLFSARVAAMPDAAALMFKDITLTYKELDEYSNQFAHYLRGKGVVRDTLVPLCMERSPEMIISIYGIMKAGGAYVPIDPEYPADRIQYILADTAADIIVSSPAASNTLAAAAAGLELVMATDRDLFAGYPVTALPDSPAANDLAYVIFTSGSTGKPKGVLVEHGGVVNLVRDQREAFQIDAGSRMLQFASIGFDASCMEIFTALSHGAVLVLPGKEELMSSAGFAALINKRKVEVAFLPPSYLHSMREMLTRVATVISCGEPLNREDGRFLQARGVRFLNGYGPTENSICTTVALDPIREDGVVVIGKPVANMQVYILDAHGGLCPVGVAGEICVSGAGLARGYLNRPELTREKFVVNPFSGDGETRMYRTGDLGRWLADGNIEYMGRIDDQVKVRGYRIELGEIENVARECEHVNEAVVVVKGGEHDNKLLVAYVIPRQEFNKDAIVAYLKSKLPEFMVPPVIIPMESFPLTPNGKVDRKGLPSPASLMLNEQLQDAGPANEIEERLLEIWKEVLNLPRLGIHDNFFAAGGNSITAIRLIAKMKVDFQVSINNLFQHPTIAGISKYVIYEKNHFKNKLAALMSRFDPAQTDHEAVQAQAAHMQQMMEEQQRPYQEEVKVWQQLDVSSTTTYQQILLLGATGYLGIHLLYDLLQRNDTPVCVLVRAESDEAAFNRLSEKYAFYFDSPLPEDRTKLRVWKGDIALPQLGMETAAFETLMSETDCILNTAANVKHYGSYSEFEAVNTRSVQTILDYCKIGRTKVIHHISTTSVAGMAHKGSTDYLYTEADLFKGQEVPNFYAKSKLEAERLLDAARREGVMVNIYRVGHLSFHSATGKFQENIDNNAFYNQIKGFISFRTMPEEFSELELSNIDQVSAAILQIFDKPALLNRNYHVRNPHMLPAADFVAYLNSYGYDMELTNVYTYLERMLQSYHTKKDLIDRLFLQADLFGDDKQDAGHPYHVCYEATNAVLRKMKFRWARLNEEKIHLMIRYAVEVGFFEPVRKRAVSLGHD
ncbi:non-ribosomal peptide synthase domain TIGR01720/amino acid adenylation domain-containing protein/thioester reductase domain-containing protein [Chitinophaga eiseniae]|uniref:Non-ribosomal peptide synthase domain TIGR01720/amino acid adenylation domain-containing protein/thioester reductase domain-containing protein n=1 Tax=Chitinophaga eiseniae TaxID=634771 RepID=A0A1T4NWT9_9BACT|nr:non-ribosomal peptide synthase/polyketide synthase [Chitinophaga eiseniae]SJZ83675.1 non-ribosomal peptide synthase domain TIGR01720/amino acid adenylation domain-containing protein/thioester reductase domain-containing protein [Chitinophaga eiseniae]